MLDLQPVVAATCLVQRIDQDHQLLVRHLLAHAASLGLLRVPCCTAVAAQITACRRQSSVHNDLRLAAPLGPLRRPILGWSVSKVLRRRRRSGHSQCVVHGGVHSAVHQ